MLQYVLFFALSTIILVCAGLVITSRRPVASAIFLIIKLFALAGIYALLQADFLAAIQIIVYAGAIMVLFLFVIMLLNLPTEEGTWLPPLEYLFGVFAFIAFLLFALLIAIGKLPETLSFSNESLHAALENYGNTQVLSHLLFTRYLWAFELASLLILLAIVASVIIAKKPTKSNLVEAADKEGAN